MDKDLNLNGLNWEEWTDFVDRWRGGEEVDTSYSDKTYWAVTAETFQRGLRELKTEGQEETELYVTLESLNPNQYVGVWLFEEDPIADDRNVTGCVRVGL